MVGGGGGIEVFYGVFKNYWVFINLSQFCPIGSLGGLRVAYGYFFEIVN